MSHDDTLVFRVHARDEYRIRTFRRAVFIAVVSVPRIKCRTRTPVRYPILTVVISPRQLKMPIIGISLSFQTFVSALCTSRAIAVQNTHQRQRHADGRQLPAHVSETLDWIPLRLPARRRRQNRPARRFGIFEEQLAKRGRIRTHSDGASAGLECGHREHDRQQYIRLQLENPKDLLPRRDCKRDPVRIMYMGFIRFSFGVGRQERRQSIFLRQISALRENINHFLIRNITVILNTINFQSRYPVLHTLYIYIYF